MSRASRRKVRADELLVQQGLAETRSKAKALVLAGDVRVGDHVVDKPGELLDPSTQLAVTERPRYVSRGGFKLEHAIEAFGLPVRDRVATDLGASTGGFTDCLLQYGAARVYAVDVGYGQLDYRLRTDERVIVMERVNARHLDSLPEPVDLVTIDVSFISLRHVLPVAARLLAPSGDVVALIKPQFEAGQDAVNRRGVVADERVRAQVVEEITECAAGVDLRFQGLTRSPVPGPAGNAEFLGWYRKSAGAGDFRAAMNAVFAGEDSASGEIEVPEPRRR